MPRETFHIAGKIKALAPGMLQVVGEKGDQWVVGISPQTASIVMHTTTTIDALQPGMFVKLTADFDAHGYAKEPIDKLQVVMLSEKTRPGVFPDSEPAASKQKGKEKERKKEQGKEREREERKEKGKGKEKVAEARNEAGNNASATHCTVVGQIKGLEDQKLVLTTGQAFVQVVVTPETSVEIEVDYRLAREGDGVKVDGWQVPGTAGQVLARRIEITGAKPITPPTPAQRQSPPAKRNKTK